MMYLIKSFGQQQDIDMRYYNKITKTELFTKGLPHLRYYPKDRDHIELHETNVFFKQVPEKMKLTYSSRGAPNGYEEIAVEE